jgi:hypothetical protein
MRFDDDRRTVPGRLLLDKIFSWTRGEVTPADFWPSEMAASETVTAPVAEEVRA